MEKRWLGPEKMEVSALGLGCMRLSKYDDAAPDESEMIRLIHTATDLGFTMFDTAQVYGPFTSEALVGKALEDRRDKVVISTKCGRRSERGVLTVDNDPAFLRSSLEGSLKRLRTDYVDLYYLHRYNAVTPIEVIADEMASLIKEGKIRGWGLSETSTQTIRRAHRICPLTAVQSEYSMMYREPEHGLLDTLEDLGIGLVPFSPLCKGFLTGGFTKDTVFSPKDRRIHAPRFNEENRAHNLAMVDYIRELAAEKQTTPSQIALAWLLHQKPWIVPIPSSTKLERVQGFADATHVHFTDAELKKIKETLSGYHIVGNRYPPHEAINVGH